MLSVHEWLLLPSAHVALHCIIIVQVLQYVAGNQEALAKDHIWRAERLPRTGGDLDEPHTGCARARKCVRYLHLSQVHHITVEYYLPLRLALLTCLEAAGPQIAASNAVSAGTATAKHRSRAPRVRPAPWPRCEKSCRPACQSISRRPAPALAATFPSTTPQARLRSWCRTLQQCTRQTSPVRTGGAPVTSTLSTAALPIILLGAKASRGSVRSIRRRLDCCSGGARYAD